MIEFPITVASFLTVLGIALTSTLVVQWIKSYLAEWRYTNLVALGLALVLSEIAQAILMQWHPTAEGIFAAGLIGFFGATLGCFGNELVKNLLGKIGIGSRSDDALLLQAIDRVKKAGAKITLSPPH